MKTQKVLKNPTTYFFQQTKNINDPYSQQIKIFCAKLINYQKCQLCKQDYDLKTYQPRIMIHCGHTFCTPCLIKFHMYFYYYQGIGECVVLCVLNQSSIQIPFKEYPQIIPLFKNFQPNKIKSLVYKKALKMIHLTQFTHNFKGHKKKLLQKQILVDPQTGLIFCVFHPQRIQHFICYSHQATGCRVCIQIGHSSQVCKVVDLYQLKISNSLNGALVNRSNVNINASTKQVKVLSQPINGTKICIQSEI